MQKINIDKEFVISMTESGHTPKEIGDILGVNECTIRNRLKEYGVTRVRKLFQITPEIMNNLKRFNREGKTNQQIADILHISPITVRKYISKMGLKFNSERTQPMQGKHRDQPVIYIRVNSRRLFYSIVFPYFIPSMYYKLEGWNRKPRELRETH